MTKSPTRKVAARKARDTSGPTDPKTAPKVAPETAPKVAAGVARTADPKTAPKVAAGMARTADRGRGRTADPKTALKVAAGVARTADLETPAQVDEFRDTQVPVSMRALAERNVAEMRELYERHKNALRGVIEIWEKSFGAAGQGAVALNHKIMDIAERNINTCFDLATSLAGARNLAEVLELQAAYWRKLFGDLQTQAEEVRVLSTKVTANVAEPIQDARVHRAND